MHLLSAVGSFIKPLALKFSNNRYHLFYLFSPTNQTKDRSVGHAISLDMMHWEHQSVLLLNANHFYPIGIYCDFNNELARFSCCSEENFVIYYHDENGKTCSNYWDSKQDNWPELENSTLPLPTNLKDTLFGMANDTNMKVLLTKNSQSFTLNVYSTDNKLLAKSTIENLSPNHVKSVRLDVGRSFVDDDRIVILLTAFIQDSNKKAYFKYSLSDDKLEKLVRTSEIGTSRRMLSLASGRILEFGVSDGATQLMILPCEVYLSQKGLARHEPLELQNCFSQPRVLDSGSFSPITTTFRIKIACESLAEGESTTLALFSNQTPLLKVTKLANGVTSLLFGYDNERYSHTGVVNELEVIVDGGIVELRNNNQPVLVLNFGNVTSVAPSIAIFPRTVEVTIASLLPEIQRD